MMTAAVTITVESQAYFSPNATMAITLPREDRAMLTKLLPIRIALSASSKRSRIFTASAAPALPLSARFSSRIRLAELSAISAPEKNAERTMHATAAMI